MAEEKRAHHQPEHIPAVLVPALLGGLALCVAVVLASLALLYPGALRQPAEVRPALPAPRLQTTETEDLQHLRADEDRRLSSYGWVDRARGIVHIPIDVAMRQVAAHGIPSWPAR